MKTKALFLRKLLTQLLTLSASWLVLASAAQAETAIYRDGTLSIPSGAVINSTGSKYYKDIVLQADTTGKFKITGATELPLVYIDSANPTVVETESARSVEIAIAGHRSVPCVQLQDVAVSRKDKVFNVVIAESVMGPAESCIAMLAPFDLKLPLSVAGLAAGTYKVIVNTIETSFVLTRQP